MKSSLAKAIELKKLDKSSSLVDMLDKYHTKDFTKRNLSTIELQPINKTLLSSTKDSSINKNAVKNIQFLPYEHERNGLGHIIESVKDIQNFHYYFIGE